MIAVYSMWMADILAMNSHPGCELLSTSWAQFEWLTFWPWIPIQDVSCCPPPKLNLNGWHSGHEFPSRVWVSVHLLSSIWMADILAMNSHPECELLCTSWSQFEWLTFWPWIPIQRVSFCPPPELNLNGWDSHHEFPSSKWVSVHLPSSIWMAEILTMNSHPASELLYTFLPWVEFLIHHCQMLSSL